MLTKNDRNKQFHYYYFFKAHQHKATGRKTRLDIQNYGCNGNLRCYHGVLLLLLFINNVQQSSHRPLTPCVATRGVGGLL